MTLHLTGDMERYLWSFNNKTITEESVVPIKKGELLRLELINDTMMHHPIHLHGFFFRLINRHGARSPLKHTVDLPPMGRHTIEFEANTAGDWMFHCHLLYHMMAGMGRVFSVRDDQVPSPAQPFTPQQMPEMTKAMPHGHSGISLGPKKAGLKQAAALGVNLGEHAHDMSSLWAAAALESHFSEGQLTYRQNRTDYHLMWEAGWQNTDRTEYEIDATWERYLGPDMRAFAGARHTRMDETDTLAIAGLRYRLPGMFWAMAQVDSAGAARLTLTKTLPLTSRLAASAKVEYDTRHQWEWIAGAEYTLTKSLSLATHYHSEYGAGGGLMIRF
jgi:Multicopper oxidase